MNKGKQMDEQSTTFRDVKNVLLNSAGAYFDMCIIVHQPNSVAEVRQIILDQFQGRLRYDREASETTVLYIDGVRLFDRQSAEFCADCLAGVCQLQHHVLSVTVLAPAGSPVEYYPGD